MEAGGLRGGFRWNLPAEAASEADLLRQVVVIGVQHVGSPDSPRRTAERFRENLTVADIAKAANVHPNYAMPLFRRHCGVTIRDYLLQYRITHAQRLLLTMGGKVIDVALANGFSSQSSFYAAFARLVKETPQAFRRRMGA